MGVWGTGLYSGDFAKDLSSAARAVSQLPFDGERLAELLCSVEPGAANNSSDEDHTTFWLVVADQFAKRGIACERVRKRALAIIDGERHVLRAYDTTYVPAGVVHHFMNESDSPMAILYIYPSPYVERHFPETGGMDWHGKKPE